MKSTITLRDAQFQPVGMHKLKHYVILQSVSANFTRLSSELYSEIDKWAGNFVITFRSSEAISELRFEIRKFKLRVYQETSKMSAKKPDDELLNWMDSFRNHLDVGESTVIYTLKENKFGECK